MPSSTHCLLIVGACLLGCQQSSGQGMQAQPSKYALLIGINQYQHPANDIKVPDAKAERIGRYEPSLTYPNLAGPANDVESIRQVLITKFHFADDPSHMIVLPNEQATHDAIMNAMQQYLVDTPKKGDIVVLYISTHGSLRIYPKDQGEGQLYNLLGDPNDQRHAENTLVPYDWNDGVDDVFSRDLRHFFRRAADKGIHVTAIFDSCHSGDLGRGLLTGKIVPRNFDFDPREMTSNPYKKEERPTLPQNDPVTPVLILSAAQKDQLAIDDGTQNPAHGVFTAALVEALNALPADRPVSDVFSRLQVSMELAQNSIHQQPEMDTSPERRRQPIFGGEAASGPTTAAVEAVNSDGVLLDIGIVADIGAGSIFTTLPDSNRTPIELKVTKSLGLGRSIAQIQPPGGTVKAKDIVQLKAAVPWQRPDLFVYAGASNLSLTDVQDAVDAITASKITLAPDPSQDPWAYHLYWDATHWTLSPHSKPTNGTHAKPQSAVDLGAKLTAKVLSHVPSDSVVWFDPPLPRESVQALLPAPTGDAPRVAAQLTADRSKAMYVVGSKLTGSTVSYAWFKRSDVDGEVQTPKWMGGGCSPGSSYPLHTEWIDQTSVASTATALNKYAVNLAKLNGWFLLQSSPLSKHQQFPYTLALRPTNEGKDISQNGITYAGDYYLYLIGKPTDQTTPQWVYVMNIDCQGNGSVVWPYDAPADKISQQPKMFPIDDANKLSPEIRLPGYSFPVRAPFGTDTYILLTTSTRLSDYHALAFDRLVSRSVTDNPLEELLDDTSGGNRLAGDPIPTNWGAWSMQVQSMPASAQPNK
jgi:hypothetical protein